MKPLPIDVRRKIQEFLPILSFSSRETPDDGRKVWLQLKEKLLEERQKVVQYYVDLITTEAARTGGRKIEITAEHVENAPMMTNGDQSLGNTCGIGC